MVVAVLDPAAPIWQGRMASASSVATRGFTLVFMAHQTRIFCQGDGGIRVADHTLR